MVDGPQTPEALPLRRLIRSPEDDRISPDGRTLFKAGYLEGDPEHIRYSEVYRSPDVATERPVESTDLGEADEQASAS